MILFKTFEDNFKIIESNFNFKYPPQLMRLVYEKVNNLSQVDFMAGIGNFLELKREDFNKFAFGGNPAVKNCINIILEPSLKNIKQNPYLMEDELIDKKLIKRYRFLLVEQFDSFVNTEEGDYAKKNRYLGYYYKNGHFADSGLVGYLGQVMLKQVQIILKYQDYNFSYGRIDIPAFNHEQQKDFNNWLQSETFEEYFKKSKKININYHRKDDMFIIAKYHKGAL